MPKESVTVKKTFERAGKPDYPKILPKPFIEGHFGFTSPGGTILLTGKHFGENAGKLVLRYRDWKGSLKSKNITAILEWYDGTIGFILPWNLEGFKHQTAKLEIISSIYVGSNLYGFQLYPVEDYKKMPAANTVSCADYASLNVCNEAKTYSGDICNFGLSDYSMNADMAIDGYHAECWGTIYMHYNETDVYEISLKNGWTFHSIEMNVSTSSDDEEVKDPFPGLPVGGSHWKPDVKWTLSPNDIVHYSISGIIAGPKGVPYK